MKGEMTAMIAVGVVLVGLMLCAIYGAAQVLTIIGEILG